LNDLRLDHACRLLRESNLTITRVSADAGFNTLTSFNRRLRERTGATHTITGAC
jgi:AraC-like DNA-binding protein